MLMGYPVICLSISINHHHHQSAGLLCIQAKLFKCCFQYNVLVLTSECVTLESIKTEHLNTYISLVNIKNDYYVPALANLTSLSLSLKKKQQQKNKSL